LSPLNSILVGTSRRPSVAVRFAAASCAVLFLALTSYGRALAATPVIHEGDVRKAEKILSKLRLLHDAAAANDGSAYRALTSKLFPELFVKVAEMRPSDLSTDLSTAVFTAEELGRTWLEAGAATADCRGERPDIYAPLCRGLRGGNVRQLLLAKSRLHAHWAEVVLKSRRGETDAETARTLDEMNMARTNDAIIAALVVEALRTLEGRPQTPRPNNVRAEGSDEHDAEFAEALYEAGALLAWMPRSPAFYRLSNARLAYADGLWWQSKARQAKSLVVSAKNFQADPLEELRLNTEQVSAAAAANWAAAAKQTRLAERVLSRR
jgi:hypothetical protein